MTYNRLLVIGFLLVALLIGLGVVEGAEWLGWLRLALVVAILGLIVYGLSGKVGDQ